MEAFFISHVFNNSDHCVELQIFFFDLYLLFFKNNNKLQLSIILYTELLILSTNNAFRHKELISSLRLKRGTNQPPLVIFADYRSHHSIVLLKDFVAMSIHLYSL